MSRAQDLFDQLVSGVEAEVLSFINFKITEEVFFDYKRSADNAAKSGRELSGAEADTF
jgi:hypothetical protein